MSDGLNTQAKPWTPSSGGFGGGSKAAQPTPAAAAPPAQVTLPPPPTATAMAFPSVMGMPPTMMTVPNAMPLPMYPMAALTHGSNTIPTGTATGAATTAFPLNPMMQAHQAMLMNPMCVPMAMAPMTMNTMMPLTGAPLAFPTVAGVPGVSVGVGLAMGPTTLATLPPPPPPPFPSSLNGSMPTRVPTRVARGRGNSGRGLRAQQESKMKAAWVLPSYTDAVGGDEEHDPAEEEEEEAVYNPLGPIVERREEERDTFHTRAALEVIGEDLGPISSVPSTRGATPKVSKAANVIGSTFITPHNTKKTSSIGTVGAASKPSSTSMVAVGGSAPSSAGSSYPFSVVGGSSHKQYAHPFTPSTGVVGGITPTTYTAHNESMSSEDDTSVLDPAKDEAIDDPAAEALRVDADTFFTEQADESQVKQAAKALQKKTENPYSITSLQGVRATMPSIERAQWYSMWCGPERVDVPAPFVPNPTLMATNTDPHAHICTPSAQYPNVKLSLFYYQCAICPIRCQLSKINDRPPDLKLGGICGDINPACIAHLVIALSGVELDALDVFGHNFGRCNLWLKNPSDAPRMMAALDRRLWMSPVPHGYAVVVDDDDSREYLLWYLEGLREHGPKRVRFPRHLMTCEKWIV